MRRTLFLVMAAVAFAGCGGEADHNVLFIGNSYTHSNDLPGIVETIGDANGVSIDTTMIAPGGTFLHEHRANPEVVAAIQSGDFDTVIFQEQSVAPSVLAFAQENTLPAAESLDTIADNSGVRVIWFQTWGHVNGFPSEGHSSYESMQAAIVNTYDAIAQRNGGTIARVGETWSRARETAGTPLYDPDGTHPSPSGSYLAAIEITESIMGHPIAEAPAIDTVDARTAQALANS